MRADRDRLADVLQAIERIECYTIAGRTVFDTDEFIQVWVVRHLQIIGEAASHTGTLLEALTSAIRDVESTGLVVCAVASDDLVSLKDIAARTGRTYESARLLASGKRGPGGLPPPVTTADGWSLYSWVQVSEWLRTNLLTETTARPDERILAAVDHLVRARCLLDNRDGLTTLADLLTPRAS